MRSFGAVLAWALVLAAVAMTSVAVFTVASTHRPQQGPTLPRTHRNLSPVEQTPVEPQKKRSGHLCVSLVGTSAGPLALAASLQARLVSLPWSSFEKTTVVVGDGLVGRLLCNATRNALKTEAFLSRITSSLTGQLTCLATRDMVPWSTGCTETLVANVPNEAKPALPPSRSGAYFTATVPTVTLQPTTTKAAVVTAASDNHFESLLHLLHSLVEMDQLLTAPVIVYSLGLSGRNVARLNCVIEKDLRGTQFAFILRSFDYTQSPPHVHMRAPEWHGNYAWKPMIIAEVLRRDANAVLWLDAGNRVLVQGGVSSAVRRIASQGYLFPCSSGHLRDWALPDQISYLTNDNGASLENAGNVNAAIIGIDRREYESVVRQWEACALVAECIAPWSASRRNHRFDQSALTVLATLEHMQCSALGAEGIAVHKDHDADSLTTRCPKALLK